MGDFGDSERPINSRRGAQWRTRIKVDRAAAAAKAVAKAAVASRLRVVRAISRKADKGASRVAKAAVVVVRVAAAVKAAAVAAIAN